MDYGFIKISRKLFESEFWLSEKFSKGQAWIDIIGMAQYLPRSFHIRGNLIQVPRGQFVRSETWISDRWQWSRGKVRRYFGELKKRGMIEQQKTRLCTRTIILNYDIYQNNSTTDETTERQQKDNNKKKKEKKENKKEKTMFAYGERFEAFWESYPKKQNKRKAHEIWKRKKLDNGLFNDVMAGLDNWKNTDQWDRGIIPHPTTWLNGERWNDELQEYQDAQPQDRWK